MVRWAPSPPPPSLDGRDIKGGVSTGSGEVYGNVVTITGGRVVMTESAALTFVGGMAIGGYGAAGFTGVVRNNSVTVSGGLVDNAVFGGFSHDTDVRNNIVEISGSAVIGTMLFISGNVTGGQSNRASAIGNKVTVLNGAVINGKVVGGQSDRGNATGNYVEITGGTLNGALRGGSSYFGQAANNTVTMAGGSVRGELSGGLSDLGQAVSNTVTMSGGTVGENIYGGWSLSGLATSNTVTMSGGRVDGDIYGGFIMFGAGNASHNTVNMAGGTVAQFIYGGYNNDTGNAAYNTVNISGGSVNFDVAGGYSLAGDATNNTVTMSGGRLGGGDIFGGYSSSGKATYNTVNLQGGTIAGGVYGGGTLGAGDVRTGNTLNVRGFQGSLQEVNNFTHYSFLLPATIQNGGTLIHITGVIPTNLAGATTSLSMVGNSTALVPGSTVVLIDKAVNKPNTTEVAATQGIAMIYDFDLSVDGRSRFIATLKNARVNPQTKALSEGRIASLALLNQGGDLFIATGLRNAQAVTEKEERFHAFGAASGASLRYNSGSHVDVDSFSMLTGGAMRNNNLLLGAFFEAGWGDYNTHNSFVNAAPVTGDGDTSYYGAGIFTRYDWSVSDSNKLYADASLRAGRVKTDFNSVNLVNAMGQPASYDLSSQYYGLHIGVGDEWNISETLLLDMSARYLWTHQKGKTAFILGDSFEFEDTDSHRLRTGARLNYTAPGSSFTPYVGAYYEHEFSATAKASVHGLNVDTPDIKGGTGIAELGFTFQPTDSKNLSLNLGVQGYAGKREGVSGDIGIKWEF